MRRMIAWASLPFAYLIAGPLADRIDVMREYASADLFCLPSRQEGFGIVFLEAMAAGLPIVAGKAGAVPEVAPHGEVSILVPPDDVDGLAGAIRKILGDTSLGERLGRAGRRRCSAYGWPAVSRRFLVATGLDMAP
jgi:glycosyltransferase involved in cell wall biosynthesis